MTFVHAADLHLDAPFQGVSAENELVGSALAAATVDALEAVVSTCVERDADFLVLAGDVYDRSDRSPYAQRAFLTRMESLEAADIPVFLACGNHDPADGWRRGWALPDNVHVFSSTAVERLEVRRNGEVACAVYGRSFPQARVLDNLSLGYRRQADDPVAVGVLHANVGADTGHENYAPCTLGDLRDGGMDYWALGHIHRHEVLTEEPYAVYSGSTQGLNPTETGVHGCCVVQLGPGGVTSCEHVSTAAVTWLDADVSVAGASDIDDVRGVLARQCEELREGAGQNAVVRLRLVGRSEAHSDLVRPGVLEVLLDELRDDQASSKSWLWVDRLTDKSGSTLDVDEIRASTGFAGDLVRIADDLAESPDALAELIDQISGPVAAKLRGAPIELDRQAVLERARDLALDGLLPRDVER